AGALRRDGLPRALRGCRATDERALLAWSGAARVRRFHLAAIAQLRQCATPAGGAGFSTAAVRGDARTAWPAIPVRTRCRRVGGWTPPPSHLRRTTARLPAGDRAGDLPGGLAYALAQPGQPFHPWPPTGYPASRGPQPAQPRTGTHAACAIRQR